MLIIMIRVLGGFWMMSCLLRERTPVAIIFDGVLLRVEDEVLLVLC